MLPRPNPDIGTPTLLHAILRTRSASGPLFALTAITLLGGCSSGAATWEDLSEDGSFLMYRRQSLIGEETVSYTHLTLPTNREV